MNCIRPATILALATLLVLGPAAARAEKSELDAELLELRDPFKKPVALARANAAPVPELQRYGSDEFKMLGVITGTGRLRAILVDPTGKTHFVSEKTRIGTRDGYIREIRDNRVSVHEKLVNAIGREEWVDVDIQLPDERAAALERR